MYEIIKTVIQSKQYELTDMIKKIDKNVRAVSYQKLLEEEAGEVESC